MNIRNFQRSIPVDKALIKNIVRAVCAKEKPSCAYQIGVCLVSDKTIQELNGRFHGCNCPTDVLAFGLKQTRHELIADIFVSADTANLQAKIYKTNPQYEMYLYVIHGLLHLTGYDDRNANDRKVMRRVERQYLKQFNIK